MSSKYTYVINRQHRDGNPNKSQWVITEDDEKRLFDVAFRNKWINNKGSYIGIFCENQSILHIGFAAKNTPTYPMKLHIAKFVVNQNVWHGFPFGDKNSDIKQISKNILDDWKSKSYITNAKMNKIHQGVYPL